MKKYVAVIDFKAGMEKNFGFAELKAENILEAMDAAEQYFGDLAYLVRIAENIGESDGIGTFEDILVKRCYNDGWHTCTDENNEHKWTRKLYKMSGKIYVA